MQGLIWEARDPWRNCRLLQFIHDFFFFSFWEHLKIQWLLSLKGEFLEVSKARLEGTTWDGRGGIYEIYEMRFMVQNHSGNPLFYFFFFLEELEKNLDFCEELGKIMESQPCRSQIPLDCRQKTFWMSTLSNPRNVGVTPPERLSSVLTSKFQKFGGNLSHFPPQQRLRLENWEFFHWEADLYKHSKG